MAGVLGVREPERLPAILGCWWIVRMRLRGPQCQDLTEGENVVIMRWEI